MSNRKCHQERDYSKYPMLKWVSASFLFFGCLSLLATIVVFGFLIFSGSSMSQQERLTMLGAALLSGLLFAVFLGISEAVDLLVDLERHARLIAEQRTKFDAPGA
jgi:hypothetical protein